MILFISRKHPPSIGGMEKFSFELTSSILKKRDGIKIVWGGSQKWLPFFYPYLLLKSFSACLYNKIKIIHLGDPVLSPIGLILKIFFKKPMVVNLHGLDITYQNRLYQFFLPRLLNKIDLMISISNQTKKEAEKRGIDRDKIVVITPGIFEEELPSLDEKKSFQPLFDITNNDFKGKLLLLTVGRLVRRKGVYYFISEVLPELDDSEKYAYLVCGGGPDYKAINDLIIEKKFEDKVFLTGKISGELLDLAYRRADIFIMPNIEVEGDMEGFGLVALEACLYKLPVVASNIEGIRNAIIDNKNGILVQPGDKNKLVSVIKGLSKDEDFRLRFGENAREFVFRNYGWDNVSDEYIKCFESLQ